MQIIIPQHDRRHELRETVAQRPALQHRLERLVSRLKEAREQSLPAGAIISWQGATARARGRLREIDAAAAELSRLENH